LTLFYWIFASELESLPNGENAVINPALQIQGDGNTCWLGDLPRTKIQEIAMRIRKPTPMPRAPADPILPSNALPQKPPRNKVRAARVLWSRDTTLRRRLNKRGSDIISTQIVVNTTISICQVLRMIASVQRILVVPN
jgi:hypothetical protein